MDHRSVANGKQVRHVEAGDKERNGRWIRNRKRAWHIRTEGPRAMCILQLHQRKGFLWTGVDTRSVVELVQKRDGTGKGRDTGNCMAKPWFWSSLLHMKDGGGSKLVMWSCDGWRR
eukprot:13329915-Ditylum_brightwellii.AAC.1